MPGSYSSNRAVVPEARSGLNEFKHDTAREIGVTLKDYNGDLPAREAGRIGGTMVKKMIQDYEQRNFT